MSQGQRHGSRAACRPRAARPARHARPPARATQSLRCAQDLLSAPEAERMIEQLAALPLEQASARSRVRHAPLQRRQSAAGQSAAACPPASAGCPPCRPVPRPRACSAQHAHAAAPRPCHISQYGSPKFLEQHDWVTQLNLQAHHNAAAQSDEFVMEALVSRGQVDTLIHGLLVAEVRGQGQPTRARARCVCSARHAATTGPAPPPSACPPPGPAKQRP